MLRAIAVKNYRSFAEAARVELRPITILLGRNSAGKSSITRLLPLLQQSLERGTSAPVLWSSSSIDFGRITDVISRANPNGSLEITFELQDHMFTPSPWHWPYHRPMIMQAEHIFKAQVKFTAELAAGPGGKTEYKKLSMTIDDSKIEVLPKGDSAFIYVDGRRINFKSSWGSLLFSGTKLFPFLHYIIEDKSQSFYNRASTQAEVDLLLKKLAKSSGNRSDRRKSKAPYQDNGASMPFIPKKSIREFLNFTEGYNYSESDRETIDALFEVLEITYLPFIVESISGAITPSLIDLSYLGPIRASGSRFYRERELSVDKIDEKGENLATYIGSLNTAELKSFNKILASAFDVIVRPHPVEGHISIDIGRPGDAAFDNLADVGFGFSQLLPLVAQLHADTRRKDSTFRQNNADLIQITAVEQPELHLRNCSRGWLRGVAVTAGI